MTPTFEVSGAEQLANAFSIGNRVVQSLDFPECLIGGYENSTGLDRHRRQNGVECSRSIGRGEDRKSLLEMAGFDADQR